MLHRSFSWNCDGKVCLKDQQVYYTAYHVRENENQIKTIVPCLYICQTVLFFIIIMWDQADFKAAEKLKYITRYYISAIGCTRSLNAITKARLIDIFIN